MGFTLKLIILIVAIHLVNCAFSDVPAQIRLMELVQQTLPPYGRPSDITDETGITVLIA